MVDDDPAFAKVVEKRLQLGGFQNTEYFSDSSECLSSLESGAKPKFIFLDFSLVTYNGLDTLIRIKKIRKSTKVIIVTQLEDEDLAKKCLKAGASLFIHKSKMMREFPDDLLGLLWPAKGYLGRRVTKN